VVPLVELVERVGAFSFTGLELVVGVVMEP